MSRNDGRTNDQLREIKFTRQLTSKLINYLAGNIDEVIAGFTFA